MNIMTTMNNKTVQSVFVQYISDHIPVYDNIVSYNAQKISKVFSGNDTKQQIDGDHSIKLFNRMFYAPNIESLSYMTQKLVNLNVSHVVLYWILAALNALKHDIVFTPKNIHYHIMILHDIGSKIFEDSPYESSLYLMALDINPKLVRDCEMDLFMVLLKVTSPHNLLFSGKIDADLFLIISRIMSMTVDQIIQLNHDHRTDSSQFYNRCDTKEPVVCDK